MHLQEAGVAGGCVAQNMLHYQKQEMIAVMAVSQYFCPADRLIGM